MVMASLCPNKNPTFVSIILMSELLFIPQRYNINAILQIRNDLMKNLELGFLFSFRKLLYICLMFNITNRRTLLEYMARYPDAKVALQEWYHELAGADFKNFNELKDIRQNQRYESSICKIDA